MQVIVEMLRDAIQCAKVLEDSVDLKYLEPLFDELKKVSTYTWKALQSPPDLEEEGEAIDFFIKDSDIPFPVRQVLEAVLFLTAQDLELSQDIPCPGEIACLGEDKLSEQQVGQNSKSSTRQEDVMDSVSDNSSITTDKSTSNITSKGPPYTSASSLFKDSFESEEDNALHSLFPCDYPESTSTTKSDNNTFNQQTDNQHQATKQPADEQTPSLKRDREAICGDSAVAEDCPVAGRPTKRQNTGNTSSIMVKGDVVQEESGGSARMDGGIGANAVEDGSGRTKQAMNEVSLTAPSTLTGKETSNEEVTALRLTP